jgi:hypothetical protein
METRGLMKKKLTEDLSTSAGTLRGCIPALENVRIWMILDCCLKDLHLLPRKKAKKPILTECMMDRRLEFARARVN